MATTIKYKDVNGNMWTVVFDTTAPVEITVPNENTLWTLITNDPGGSLETDHVGNKPKR